ncbi:MAG TPA: alpha-amylase, partial [Halomonas sp.]|nr:alpha-amylase [Halomonas sp.]
MTAFEQTVHRYLTHLYGPRAGEVQRRIGQHLAHFRAMSTTAPTTSETPHDAPTWSEQDQWVICYGDSIVEEGTPPLAVLDTFLQRYLGDAISGVHVLPFFPWSSDDGFSVIHYR